MGCMLFGTYLHSTIVCNKNVMSYINLFHFGDCYFSFLEITVQFMTSFFYVCASSFKNG